MKEKFKSEFIPLWKTANPYSYKNIKEKREYLVKNMTPTEIILWDKLKANQLGIKFRRQHVIVDFIPDFVALSQKIIIEIDGKIHDFTEEYDSNRQYLLEQEGYTVLRFCNDEVLNNLDNVLIIIKEAIQQKDNKN
jgi:very-short-patch-repair endonuclease